MYHWNELIPYYWRIQREGAPGTCAPGPISFIVMQFSAKILPNNRFLPLLTGNPESATAYVAHIESQSLSVNNPSGLFYGETHHLPNTRSLRLTHREEWRATFDGDSRGNSVSNTVLFRLCASISTYIIDHEAPAVPKRFSPLIVSKAALQKPMELKCDEIRMRMRMWGGIELVSVDYSCLVMVRLHCSIPIPMILGFIATLRRVYNGLRMNLMCVLIPMQMDTIPNWYQYWHKWGAIYINFHCNCPSFSLLVFVPV